MDSKINSKLANHWFCGNATLQVFFAVTHEFSESSISHGQ